MLKTTKIPFTALAVLAAATVMIAQSFKVYPGSTKYTPPDNEETRKTMKSMPPGMLVSVYLSNDSFEKVAAFYQALGKEYTILMRPRQNRLRPTISIDQNFDQNAQPLSVMLPDPKRNPEQIYQ